MIVGMNLGLAGMEFGEAVDGNEALEMLRSGSWDGCILDLAMPRMDGFQVLEHLKDEGILDRTGVLVLSANGTPSTAIRAMKLGAHTHLSKPFSPASVAETMKELLELDAEERTELRLEMIDRAGNLDRLGVRTI